MVSGHTTIKLEQDEILAHQGVIALNILIDNVQALQLFHAPQAVLLPQHFLRVMPHLHSLWPPLPPHLRLCACRGAQEQQDYMSIQQKNPIFLLLFFYNKIDTGYRRYFG